MVPPGGGLLCHWGDMYDSQPADSNFSSKMSTPGHSVHFVHWVQNLEGELPLLLTLY